MSVKTAHRSIPARAARHPCRRAPRRRGGRDASMSFVAAGAPELALTRARSARAPARSEHAAPITGRTGTDLRAAGLRWIQQLFPSQDGNPEQRARILHWIERIVTDLDAAKHADTATLGAADERAADFYGRLLDERSIPASGIDLDSVVDELSRLTRGHPYQTKNYFANAVPVPSIAGVLGFLTLALVNSNPIWDLYGPAAAEAEVSVVGMMSKLIGYDPRQSGGYTTWGGQGAVFNGLRLAIAKHVADAQEAGIPGNLYCFASEGAHYSLLKSVQAAGIGTRRLVTVKTRPDHSMDVDDLAAKMQQVIEHGGIPIYVVATTGTTDSFGIDDVRAIKAVSDRVARAHGLKPAHIHADSAMGGFYAFFNDYDFASNPLHLEPHVLAGLAQIRERIRHLALADSACFDFHKLGQLPYASSLFLVKDRRDFGLVDMSAAESPYMGARSFGGYFTSHTLECSRMGSAIAMYATLLAFGATGWQALLANYVRVNLAFRRVLAAALPEVAVLNDGNPGPLTAFRVYPGRPAWRDELSGNAAAAGIEEVNRLNERLFALLGRDRAEIYLGDTKKLCTVEAMDSGERIPIYAVKLFCISPHTREEHVGDVVRFIEKRVKELREPVTTNNL